MVAVVQLVEHQVVILGVAGSSPVSHPAGRRALALRPFASRELVRGFGHFFPKLNRPFKALDTRFDVAVAAV